MPITKQTIAIIGAGGNMGSAIAKSIADGNYRLLLFDKHLEEPSALAEEIRQQHSPVDIKAMDCAHDCSWEADIIIMAVPYDQQTKIADTIRDVATQKIVVSLANPAEETRTSAAEKLQALLSHSKVIKAFNTVVPANFEDPVIEDKQIDNFIAGDDQQALVTVSEIVQTAGFHPVVIDNLAFSRTLEQMSVLLEQITKNNDGQRPGGWKILSN